MRGLPLHRGQHPALELFRALVAEEEAAVMEIVAIVGLEIVTRIGIAIVVAVTIIIHQIPVEVIAATAVITTIPTGMAIKDLILDLGLTEDTVTSTQQRQ